jgi:hypothetical protein
MSTSIGNVFGKIQTVLNDVTDLEKPLSADGFEKALSLDTGSHTLQVFDTPVAVQASAEAKVQIFKNDEVPESPFGATPLKVAADQRYTALTVGGKLTASAGLSASPGVLNVSATASTKTSFSYAHYLPLPATMSRLDAFLALGASSTLPQLADVKTLRPGEVLDFGGLLNVDFGLQAKYGAQADVNGDLLSMVTVLSGVAGGTLTLPFKLHVGFTASAALGFSLYESMKLTVGAAATTKDDFVRMRLEREHRSRIAFGIVIDLTIAYDAKAGAQALIDKAFALIPKVKAIETLKTVAKAPADWEAFKAQITGEAASVVGRLLNDTHWKDALEESDAVKTLTGAAKKIVDAYAGIDAKVQSIIEEVIARLDDAGLAKVKPILTKIAGLNAADLMSLLPAEGKDVVHWIEVLTGQDIEELIISSNIEKELARAVDGAKKINAFLDGGASAAVLKEIHALLDKSGASALVAWLKKNATSVASLEAAADTAISDWVKRIVGKELDQIGEADVEKIQAFAAKLDQLLNMPQTLQNRLTAATSKLKGTIGFSAAAEISRVSEWTAIVDVEIDPKNDEAAAASKQLLHGRFGDFLKALNDIDKTAYFIHEILLTSRRVRTSAATTVAAFLRFNLAESETAIDESTISIRVDDTGNNVRDALYVGGTVVRRSLNDSIAESAAWVRMPATGPGTSLDAPYSATAPGLRLTYAREDDDASDKTRDSIRRLLGELSFASAVAAVPGSDQKQTRFSLQLEFDGVALQALKENTAESEWNSDVLKAANRWLSDVGTDAVQASVMANVVLDPEFKNLWPNFAGVPSDVFVNADINQKFGPRLLIMPSKQFKPEFGPIRDLMSNRHNAFANFSAFSPTEAASTQPDVLLHCSRKAADLFRTGQTGSTPPLFNFWFVIRRLFRLNPDVFKKARMVATIRSRKTANDTWSDPRIFAMTKVSTDNLSAVLKS